MDTDEQEKEAKRWARLTSGLLNLIGNYVKEEPSTVRAIGAVTALLYATARTKGVVEGLGYEIHMEMGLADLTRRTEEGTRQKVRQFANRMEAGEETEWHKLWD